MRKYLSGVSQSMAASFLCWLLAPFAQAFLPSKSAGIPLNTSVALIFWLVGLAGLIFAIVKLKKYRKLTLEILDFRCQELISSCAGIRQTYPTMIGPITATTYVPLPDAEKNGDKAAMHKFRGRLFDFLNDAGKFEECLKTRLPLPSEESIGNLESVERQLTEIHTAIKMALF